MNLLPFAATILYTWLHPSAHMASSGNEGTVSLVGNEQLFIPIHQLLSKIFVNGELLMSPEDRANNEVRPDSISRMEPASSSLPTTNVNVCFVAFQMG